MCSSLRLMKMRSTGVRACGVRLLFRHAGALRGVRFGTGFAFVVHH